MLPDVGVLVTSVQRCQQLKSLECARRIYENACLHGLDLQSCVGICLAQMLAECGLVSSAQQISRRIDCQNEFHWTTLILGCVYHVQLHRAFDLYHSMKRSNVPPSVYTFMALLRACTMMHDVERGHEVHADIVQNFGELDIYIGNALIDMYAKSGCLIQARGVFDQLSEHDVVSWTALIGGYAEHGPGELALECFWIMKEKGIAPNDITLVCVFKACGSIGALAEGVEIARDVIENGPLGNTILGNSLINMYAKCGALTEAQEVFDRLMLRNLVSWNALIAGYADHGPIHEALNCFQRMRSEGISPDEMSWTSLISGFSEHGPAHEALNLYDQMRREGIVPDEVAYASALKACGNVGAIDIGQEMHNEITLKDYMCDLFICNNLIEMYAQSGLFLEAQAVFDKLAKRDLCVWNTIIKACGVNREGRLAVRYFEAMEEQRVEPDLVTFSCLLTACSRACMIVESQQYITLMRNKYRIMPTVDHYTIVVDLLARFGHMEEAESFLLQVVPKSFQDDGTWAALLTACIMYGELEIGERCHQHLVATNAKIAQSASCMTDVCINLSTLENSYENKEQRQWSGDKKKKLEGTALEVQREAQYFVDQDTSGRHVKY